MRDRASSEGRDPRGGQRNGQRERPTEATPVRIEAAERALLTLGDRLDRPFEAPGEPEAVAMALGHRARALYRGYLGCIEADHHVAARVLLRPMVETNILLRFIREQPEARSLLWHAETRRTWIGLALEMHDRPLPAEQQLEGLPTKEQLAEWRREIDQIRKEAIAAGVEGVGPKGRLIPTVRRQAELLNTEQVWQGYVVAYMPLGFEQHVASGSFRDSVLYELDDGGRVYRESETPKPVERLLASSLFASTLVIVSSWFDLGIEDAADRVRARIVGK